MWLLHQLFDSAVERFPDHTALSYHNVTYAYRVLQDRSVALSRGLEERGIGRGDRVVICLQNRPEVVEMSLACSRIGAIFVPVSPLLKARQLGHILNTSGAVMLVTSALTAGNAINFDACPGLRSLVLCDGFMQVDIKGLHGVDRLAYEEMFTAADSLRNPALPAIDADPAAIFFTSGSTGKSKGVVVSHRNLVSGAQSVSSYLQNRSDDRLLAVLPLSFDYGFSQLSTAFVVGATVVLTNYSTAAALVQEMAVERITGLAGVPTMWGQVSVLEWPAAASESVRYITNSGGALPSSVMRRLRSRLPGAQLYCMYGLTEAFRSTFLEPSLIDSRPGSIGKAIPNQEVLVLRPDGTECAPGEVGELVHRGSLVALGYWNDTERTQRRFRPIPSKNGGLLAEYAVWSGDLVRADEDGYLYFVGRGDDLIKTSGYRVSPAEIEEVVQEVPGVVEALAIGLPDDLLGHRIAVVLVTDGAADEGLEEIVRQYCRMQLPPYMAPAHIKFVRSIPRNQNGKHDRVAVLESLVASLAEAPASQHSGGNRDEEQKAPGLLRRPIASQ